VAKTGIYTRNASAPGSAPAQEEADARPLVLVCDDEPPIRHVLRNILEKQNLRVLEASNGETSLALARQQAPNLILLDSMMPHLSGMDCLKSLRQTAKTSRIPVIMVTARKDPNYIRECMRYGISGYVAKPFQVEALVEKVRSALQDANPDGADAR